jgi:hypothetical protein
MTKPILFSSLTMLALFTGCPHIPDTTMDATGTWQNSSGGATLELVLRDNTGQLSASLNSYQSGSLVGALSMGGNRTGTNISLSGSNSNGTISLSGPATSTSFISNTSVYTNSTGKTSNGNLVFARINSTAFSMQTEPIKHINEIIKPLIGVLILH